MKYPILLILSFCCLLTACTQTDSLRAMMHCGGLPVHKASRARFAQLYNQIQNMPQWVQLVDDKHLLPHTYTPEDLTCLNPKICLRQEVMQQMQTMIKAAKKDGVELRPLSAFRSYQYQKGLVARSRPNNPYIAKPGASQHQLGTAIDFNTLEPKDEHIVPLQWLSQHAREYGFSLSFPKGKEAEAESGYPYEPWHYRYISLPAVQMQDEFFAGNQHKLLVFLDKCHPDTAFSK